MKKLFEIFATLSVTLIIVLIFCSCAKQNERNIDEFIDEMNEISQTELSAEDFGVVLGERTEYKYMFDNHSLMCLYADGNGAIVQCTVTTDAAADETFLKRCALAAKILTGCDADTAQKLCETAKKSGQTESGRFKVIFNDYKVGRTMIINHTDDEINTNTLPTLKRTVKYEDISRPTAAVTEKKSE